MSFIIIPQDKKSVALELIDIFNSTFEKLAEFPNIGVTRKGFTYLDVKFFVVNKRYLVVYNIENDLVTILIVLASYQDICSKL